MKKHLLSSQTVPLQIMSSEKYIQWLSHVLLSLVQERLTWAKRRAAPIIAVLRRAFKMGDSSLCVSTHLPDWVGKVFIVRFPPEHLKHWTMLLLLCHQKNTWAKAVSSLSSFRFGCCASRSWMVDPVICYAREPAFLSHNCFPGLSLCGAGVLHYNSFFTHTAVRR